MKGQTLCALCVPPAPPQRLSEGSDVVGTLWGGSSVGVGLPPRPVGGLGGGGSSVGVALPPRPVGGGGVGVGLPPRPVGGGGQ